MSASKDDYKPSFIPLKEFNDFQRPMRFVSRTIVENLTDTSRVGTKSDLIKYVEGQIELLMKADRPWFGCACIEVKEDDGISWDCEAVNRFVTRRFTHLKRWAITPADTTEELPVIANFIKLRTFLKVAVVNKLTDPFSFVGLRSWTRPAIILGSLLVGVLIETFKAVQKAQLGANPTVAEIVSAPRFYLTSAGLVALGIAAQTIATFMSAGTKSKSVEKLATRLALKKTTSKESQNYDRFVHALAQRLQSADFPRVVLIENFANLDPTTRLVIDLYFEKYAEDRRGSEFWIVFENEIGDRFSSRVLQNRSREGYRRTKLFRQSLLTEEEKLNLVKLLGKPTEAAEYATVKGVCQAQDVDRAEIETFFKSYRDKHPRNPEQYDDLDFFFLLSLTADNIPITQKFILANLPVKSGLRSDVLNLYLPGTKLRIEEFRGAVRRVLENFGEFLIIEPDGELTKLKVLPEKSAILQAKANDFGLKRELGHVFWALLWHDKLQSHPIQAVLIRKLTRHLLNADASSIKDNQSYLNIRSKLFDASLLCVDASLKACLFQQIIPLLEQSANILRETELPNDELYQKKLRRLLSRCWQVYTILGDENVLKLIVDLYGPPEKAISYHRESSRLEKMFLESMLSADQRRGISPELLENIYGRAETNKPIADYAQARASWLAVSAGQLIDSDVCKFISAILEADSNLPGIADAAFQRLKEVSDESVHLTDVTTLSLSLWCGALRFNPALIDMREHAYRSLEAAHPEDPFEGHKLSFLVPQDFSGLLEIAENAVLLADKARRPQADENSELAGTDWLMNGLAKELGAISLASTLTAASYIAASGFALTPEHLKDINGIIKTNNDLLGLSLPEVKNAQDLRLPGLLEGIDSLMKLCGVIWKHFGLERLSDFINIRRLHFTTQCLPGTDSLASKTSMLQSLVSSIDTADYAGIMANLTVAKLFASTGEIAAHYFIRAAELALAADFGKPIKDQLVLVALKEGHSYDHDLDTLVRHAVADIPGQKTLLERFLSDVTEEDLPGVMLAFLNIARRTKQPADLESLMSCLRQFAATIGNEAIKREVESQLELQSIRELIAKGGTVDLPALFHSWNDRRDLWLYPSVLRLLLEQNYSPPDVKQESLAILEHRQPERDSYNTYFLLSLTLASQLTGESPNGERSIPLSYLKGGIERWQSSLAPETNVKVYKVFYRWDPDNKDYYVAQILNWQVNAMEGDRLKRLPRLMIDRHFFFVFRYYFEALQLWGLETNVDPADLQKRTAISIQQRRDNALSWKNAGEIVPQPLLRVDNGNAIVNSDFLLFGSYLFNQPCMADSGYDNARTAFNDQAKLALDELFQTIHRLPGLPVPIRAMMQSHHDMILKWTLP